MVAGAVAKAGRAVRAVAGGGEFKLAAAARCLRAPEHFKWLSLYRSGQLSARATGVDEKKSAGAQTARVSLVELFAETR